MQKTDGVYNLTTDIFGVQRVRNYFRYALAIVLAAFGAILLGLYIRKRGLLE